MKKKVDEAGRRYLIFLITMFAITGFIFLIRSPSIYNNLITGAVPSATTTATVTINAAPYIVNVSIIGNTSNPISITESDYKLFNFSFVAIDPDGMGNLDNSSAAIQINITKYLADGTTLSTVRFNYSCNDYNSVDTAFSVNYSCSVYIWYFDAGGSWTINASIKDINGVYAENRTIAFGRDNQILLGTTTAMKMSPTALTWPSLELSAVNQTSNNDPITINNTGNKDISAGGITVTGYDLWGLTNADEYMRAQNFSVHAINGTSACTGINCLECNGTQLLNATGGVANPQTLSIANMTAGNNSFNFANQTSGQENIFFCLRTVSDKLSRQTYDTSNAQRSSPWTVTVS